MKDPLFNVTIDVSGPAGNAFVIIGTVIGLLKEAKYSKQEIDDIEADMTSSNYEHLLEVASNYVHIIGE